MIMWLYLSRCWTRIRASQNTTLQVRTSSNRVLFSIKLSFDLSLIQTFKRYLKASSSVFSDSSSYVLVSGVSASNNSYSHSLNNKCVKTKRLREKQLSLFNSVQIKERSEVSGPSSIPVKNFQDNPVALHRVNNCEINSNEWNIGQYV